MRTVTYRLADLEKKVSIHIGRLGENEVTRVQIDAGSLFAEYPAAVASMSVENPEGVKYPATVTRDGDMVIWDVRDSDLAKAGHGEIQWTFTENGAILKSAIARTSIGRSIVGEGTPPDPLEDWIEHAEDVLEQVDGAFPKGGSAGQVLAKKSGADYDTEWVNQGSGGTGDYEDLENLPKIGGVELKGDKSLSDLGAAAESDIPDVSGFYTKPGSGIPASDLADGVIPDVSGFYTKPSGGIPASDIADGVIPDPAALIDDTAGAGDTEKVWSADKSSSLLSAITKLTPDATASDVGKAIIVKTVADGKPSSYEYGEAGGGGAVIDDTAGAGDTDKAWSADKIVTEIQQIIVSGGVPIDDTAGEGDIDKIWSADKNAKEFAKVGDDLTVEGKTMAARTFTGGGYRRISNGGSFAETTSTEYYTSGLIELPDGCASVKIRQYRPAGNATDPTKSGWSVVNFFNSSQAVISNQISNSSSADTDYTDNTYSVPSGAKYVSFLTQGNYRAEARCQIGTTEKSLSKRVETLEDDVRSEEVILIDESTLTTGVLYRDGGISSSVAYRTTDYIPCTQGDIFEITSLGVAASWMWQVGYYDSSKNCITYAYKGTGTSTLITFDAEVPYSNAKYIRISYCTENKGSLKVVKKSLVKNSTPLVITLNKQSLDDALGAGICKGRFTNSNNPDALVLLHFSDIHGTADNLKDISSVRSYLASVLDDTLCTGDIMNSNFSNSYDFWDDNSDGTILTCIGNHDVQPANAGTGYLVNQKTEAELYGRYMENYISNWGTVEHSDTNLYYYKDYPTKKIRLIVLNLLYPTSEKVTEQNTWLATALAGAKTAGYGVVIGEHYYPVTGTKISCTFSAEYNFPSSMSSPENYMYNGDALTTYQVTVQDFIDGGGNFVCWLCGHKHADYIVYHPTYPKQVFIGVGGALFTDRAHELDHTSDMRRVFNTRSQNCMNVLSIDPKHKTIKIIRIGCDRDYLGRHRGSLTLDYSTSPATVVYND